MQSGAMRDVAALDLYSDTGAGLARLHEASARTVPGRDGLRGYLNHLEGTAGLRCMCRRS
jgi:hypothetical protein